MAKSARVDSRRRTITSRAKVKTGCGTCRIRKIKCDEGKPICHKCVKTGRTCDGYESPFRLFNNQSVNKGPAGSIKPDDGLQNSAKISSQDIALLNRYFSTKTMFDVKLGCDEEAEQVLEASLTDPSIRHAVSSLRALREDLEPCGDGPASVPQQTLSYYYGLQQYCMAMGSLASNMSTPSSEGLKSALLCCQIFISIEQAQGNFATVAEHIIRGLRIMHEYRARPGLVGANRLVPAQHDQLPLLDVFIIKLFVAPCKFADRAATHSPNNTTSSGSSISPPQQPLEIRESRVIVPDMRAQLTKIAASTLEFLSRVSHVGSAGNAVRLLPDKAALLHSLQRWRASLVLVEEEIGRTDAGPLSVSFMRLFHQLLRLVILSALDYSHDLASILRTENVQLQNIAKDVNERVRAYRASSGRSSPTESDFKPIGVTIS